MRLMMRGILRVIAAAALFALGVVPRAAAQTTEYYTLDAIGSVRVITDQTGAVIERHDYLPFGEEWNPTTSNDARKLLARSAIPRPGTTISAHGICLPRSVALLRWIRASSSRITSSIRSAGTGTRTQETIPFATSILMGA